jgi:prepilin-type N-terminal cleavage/methylation domain-containing protein
MQNKKGFTLIELVVVIGIIAVLASAVLMVFRKAHASDGTNCGGWFEPSCSDTTVQQQDEQQTVTNQINRLQTAVPIPSLESSLERQNISRRLQLFSNESKISYIYLTSFGKVMAFYTVKGKITSGGKRLTSEQRLIDNTNYSSAQYITEAPELDGTYGHSGDYIYFWTTDGTYVQWNGEYMLADQPLQLTTQPELVRTVK